LIKLFRNFGDEERLQLNKLIYIKQSLLKKIKKLFNCFILITYTK